MRGKATESVHWEENAKSYVNQKRWEYMEKKQIVLLISKYWEKICRKKVTNM